MDESEEVEAQIYHEHYEGLTRDITDTMVTLRTDDDGVTHYVPGSSSSGPDSSLPSKALKNMSTTAATAQASPQIGGEGQATQEGFYGTLMSGKFSDLLIIDGTTSWNAHKVIVCSQSPVLEAAVAGLKPGAPLILSTQSSLTCTTKLLEYLYTSSYTFTTTSHPDHSLNLHFQIFLLSLDLSIPGLENLATQNYRTILESYLTDIPFYFSCINSVFAATPASHPGLRNALVECAVGEMENVLKEDGGFAGEFLGVMGRVPEFGREVLRLLASGKGKEVEVEAAVLCEECGPLGEDDVEPYVVEETCRKCRVVRSFEFL